eukprot:CAMPEP_0196780302 /NCGR_PEP_ID=MMETSP1104-20130614/7496_1 /TAXON_ID=33652 /ORGANISM="Cafeteria sp., Strain Caron Lab Isolate" /LENGTH=56 /DNA_ID=CAMNT_0042150499 /DNA_START=96 /DNA_END=262 /DNA_ORIENTATION=-
MLRATWRIAAARKLGVRVGGEIADADLCGGHHIALRRSAIRGGPHVVVRARQARVL